MHASLLPISLAAAAAASTAGAASAQSFLHDFSGASSSIDLDLSLGLDLSGSIRGAGAPSLLGGGTRTQPGLFGDDGTNAEIPISLGLALALDVAADLDGSFSLTLDQELGTATVEDFFATLPDLPGAAGIDVTFEFSTFRTFSPDSLYLGGFPLTLPLGAGDLANIELVQSQPAVGTATPGAMAGTFDLVLAVPVDFSFTFTAGLLGGGGDPIPVGPLPLLLPLSVTLDLADCGASLTGGAMDMTMQSIPSPFPLDFDDLPLDLPTILPPGNTANLLLSAGLDSLTVDLGFDVALAADSTVDGRFEDICSGMPNSTGAGAAMGWVGSPSTSAADLGLQVTGLPTDVFGMLIMSGQTGFIPGFGGSQGDLCLGEPCFRFFDNVQNSGAMGEMTFFPDFGALPMGVTIAPADTWNFQVWYRDMNPGVTSNTSGAMAVTFCQ